MADQSRLMSMAEAGLNSLVSIALGTLTQMVVFPFYGIKVTVTENVSMVLIFTAVSFARNYIVRRFFSRRRAPDATPE